MFKRFCGGLFLTICGLAAIVIPIVLENSPEQIESNTAKWVEWAGWPDLAAKMGPEADFWFLMLSYVLWSVFAVISVIWIWRWWEGKKGMSPVIKAVESDDPINPLVNIETAIEYMLNTAHVQVNTNLEASMLIFQEAREGKIDIHGKEINKSSRNTHNISALIPTETLKKIRLRDGYFDGGLENDPDTEEEPDCGLLRGFKNGSNPDKEKEDGPPEYRGLRVNLKQVKKVWSTE